MAKREKHQYEKINVRLEHSDMEKVRAYAKKHGLTTGAVIRAALVNNVDFLTKPASSDDALEKMQRKVTRLQNENKRLKAKLSDETRAHSESEPTKRVNVMSKESYMRLLETIKPITDLRSDLAKLGNNINQRVREFNAAWKSYEVAYQKLTKEYNEVLAEYKDAERKGQIHLAAQNKKKLGELRAKMQPIEVKRREYIKEYAIAPQVYDDIQSKLDVLAPVVDDVRDGVHYALHEDKRH